MPQLLKAARQFARPVVAKRSVNHVRKGFKPRPLKTSTELHSVTTTHQPAADVMREGCMPRMYKLLYLRICWHTIDAVATAWTTTDQLPCCHHD